MLPKPSSPADTALQNALRAHDAGRLTEAEVGYRRVLRKRPNEPRALYGLGLLAFHSGAIEAGIQYVTRCVEHAPGDSRAWNTLGSMYQAANNSTLAATAYQRATEVAPQSSDGWYNLGICLKREGDFDGAVERLRRATTCVPPSPQAFEALGSLLYQLGQTHEAATTFIEWAQREPANPRAQHMAAAASGRSAPRRASDDYIQTHFDAAADSFDHQLERLGYQAPQLVVAALVRIRGSLLDTVLDAGCGTGLCGPLIRPRCQTLAGVDLSAKMLARAQERGCYDELVTAEMAAFMRSRPRSFDAIISADTFVYFGDVGEPLSAAHATLRGSGLLSFTAEALPKEETADFRLNISGRYAHSETYLRRALTASGFLVESISCEKLREERAESVPGHVVVARCR